MENIMENVIDTSDFFGGNDEVELFARSDKSKSKSSSTVAGKIGKSVSKKTKSKGKSGLIIGIVVVIIIIIIVLIILKSKSKKNKSNDKPPKVEEEVPENVVVENNGKPYPAEGESNVVTPPPVSNAPNADISQSQYQPLQYPQGTYPPQNPVGQYQPIQFPCSLPPATMPPMTQGGYPPQGYNINAPLPNTTQPPLGTVPPNLTNFASTEVVAPESINAMPQLK